MWAAGRTEGPQEVPEEGAVSAVGQSVDLSTAQHPLAEAARRLTYVPLFWGWGDGATLRRHNGDGGLGKMAECQGSTKDTMM